MTSKTDRDWMQRALQLAEQAAQMDEVPVGAVLVLDGKVVGEGFNSSIKEHDTTAHAEIQAIRQANQKLQNYRLPDTTLYITLEPCAMCAGAIVHARIKRVVIAAREPRSGAAGSIIDLLTHPQLNHRCEVEFGLMTGQSANLLRSFFRNKRKA